MQQSSKSRGVFILIEGVDRSGKTTQSRLLCDALSQQYGKVSLLNYPNRSTEIGQIINEYLLNKKSYNSQTAHLLFAANRWESAEQLTELLSSGVHIVMDRYSYSGVAFTTATSTMSIDQCWSTEIGLPKPDVTIFLHLPVKKATTRGGYGQERYETISIQERVNANFKTMINRNPDDWCVVDGSQSIYDIHEQIMLIAQRVIREKSNSENEVFT